MPARKVTYDRDGKVVVEPCYVDHERLKISEYHRTYVALDPDGCSLYHLHRCWLNLDRTGLRQDFQKGYVWLALWNALTFCSMDNQKPFDNIEQALSAALDAGYAVRQLNMDIYKYLIEDMQKDIEEFDNE